MVCILVILQVHQGSKRSMTDLYDILETFAGTPGDDPFFQIVIYVVACAFALVLFLGVIDVMYWIAKSWSR